MTVPMQLQRPDLCSLQALDDKMAAWHERKYGSPAPTNQARTFAKLVEEVGEFAEAWNNYYAGKTTDSVGTDLSTRRAQVLEELADIILVCLNLSRAVGGGLPMAILQKLQVIHERLYTDKRVGRNLLASNPPKSLVVREDALSPSWASPAVAGVQVVEGSP